MTTDEKWVVIGPDGVVEEDLTYIAACDLANGLEADGAGEHFPMPAVVAA